METPTPDSLTSVPVQKTVPTILVIGLVLSISLSGVLGFFLYSSLRTQASLKQQLTANPTITPTARYPLDAQVTYATGEVWTLANGRRLEVKEGDTLTIGSSIITNTKSRVSLRFDDGSVISLDENTQVSLNTLTSQLMELKQQGGRTYSRVHKDEKHAYVIKVGTATITAMGTEFAVDDTKDLKVTVFESSVKVQDSANNVNQEVKTKEQWTETTKTAVVASNSVNKDDFLAWNLKQGEENSSTPEPTPTPEVTATPKPAEPSSITLHGNAEGDGIKFTWEVKNLSVTQGFKLIKSSEPNPVFPGNEYTYIESSSSRSYTWNIKDGQTRHFRVCKYHDGKCAFYSNDITVKAPGESASENNSSGSVQSITARVEKVGDDHARVSWDVNGNSPYGFKIVWSTDPEPVFPGDTYNYEPKSTTRSTEITHNLEDGKTYYFRVCEYLGGSCGKYSNQVSVSF